MGADLKSSKLGKIRHLRPAIRDRRMRPPSLKKFESDIPSVIDPVEIDLLEHIPGLIDRLVHRLCKRSHAEHTSPARYDRSLFRPRTGLEDEAVRRIIPIQTGDRMAFLITSGVTAANRHDGTGN